MFFFSLGLFKYLSFLVYFDKDNFFVCFYEFLNVSFMKLGKVGEKLLVVVKLMLLRNVVIS